MGLENIAYDTFEDCKALEVINYAGNKDQWDKIKKDINWIDANSKIVINYNSKI